MRIEPGRSIPFNLLGSDTVVQYFLPAKLSDQAVLSEQNQRSDSARFGRTHVSEVLLPFVLVSLDRDPEPDQVPDCPYVPLLPTVDVLGRDFRAAPRKLTCLRAALGLPDAPRTQGMHWVGGPSPDKAWLVPPPGNQVSGYLHDLESTLTRVAGLPAAALPVLAYQLIHVHPYVDGNGRTARLLSWLSGAGTGDTSMGLALALTMNFRKEWTNRHFEQARLGVVQPWIDGLARARSWIEAETPSLQGSFNRALDDAFRHEHLSRLRPKVEGRFVSDGALNEDALRSACGSNAKLAGRYMRTMADHGWERLDCSGGSALHWPGASSERACWIRRFLGALDSGQLAG